MKNLIRDRGKELFGPDPMEHCSLEEYFPLLKEKLNEETGELLREPSLEEAADVLEVLFAFAKHLGHSEDDLLNARKKKFDERGGFYDGLCWIKPE